jgi:hypothetical protein
MRICAVKEPTNRNASTTVAAAPIRESNGASANHKTSIAETE